MGLKRPYYLILLEKDFEKKQRKNPSFSLRGYALSLNLDPAALSRYLSRKNIPSVKVAQLLCKKLSLEGEQKDEFILSLIEESKCASIKKELPHKSDCSNNNDN